MTIVVICLLGVFYLSYNKSNGNEIDLTELKHDDFYQYKQIPWGTSKEDVERKLDITLTEMKGTQGVVYRTENVLKGEFSDSLFEFHEGLSEIKFQFGNMNSSKTEKDLTDLKNDILNELVRTYGEFEEKTELQNSRDRKEISYKWFTMDAENVDTYLYLDVVSNEERVFYISLAVGENIDIGSL